MELIVVVVPLTVKSPLTVNAAAVIVPALKLPEASLATIADAVLALVAVVALLDTFPAVDIVANLVSAIPADALMSASTITPAAIEVVLPTDVTSPARFALVVTLDAVPVKLAVIVPALKLPEASLATIVDAVLALVAFEVTVNVVAPDWLAVKDADPDRPVPATAIVRVPFPKSEVKATVPVLAGRVIVLVPATAVGCTVIVPEVEPGIATLKIPVRAWFADALFRTIAVVPTWAVELPSTDEGIVPLKFPAVRLVKLAPDTAPKEPDQVPEVTVPVVVKLEDPAKGDAPRVLYEIV